jgi:hypothetical protein
MDKTVCECGTPTTQPYHKKCNECYKKTLPMCGCGKNTLQYNRTQCYYCFDLIRRQKQKCSKCDNIGVKQGGLCESCFLIQEKKDSISKNIKCENSEYSDKLIEITYKINYKFSNINIKPEFYYNDCDKDIFLHKLYNRRCLLLKEFDFNKGEKFQITDEFKKYYDIDPYNNNEDMWCPYGCSEGIINCEITAEIISAELF